MDHTILIIEDDKTQNTVLANFLKNENYTPRSAFCLEEAREMLDDEVSLVVLDVMLPDGNGLDFLKELRGTYTMPVIMLTALDDEYTQITSFDLKADEYVDKPVSPVVMTKRISALLERVYGRPSFVQVGGYRFDFGKYQVFNDQDEEIPLTTKEMNILKFLYKQKGNVSTRDQVIHHVWGYEYIGDDRLLDAHMRNIRKKLSSDIIITIKNVGYRLNMS